VIVDREGRQQNVRLWPGKRAGEFEAWIDAPAAGLHVITVSGDGTTADAVLRVDDTVIHAAGGTRAAETVTRLTGGALAHSVDEVIAKLRELDTPEVAIERHPLRSPLWILPFAGCLCAEWYLRRRRGDR
jgi:hypothetical protein